MKIAIFADCFYPQVNGIVTVINNVSHGLAKKGHKVLIIAPKYRNVEYPKFHKNIEIITVRGSPAFFYPNFKITPPFKKKIHKALIKNKIEIVHFHTPMGLGIQAILLSKILKIPLIGTFHTFFAESEYLKHAKADYKIVKSIVWQLTRLYYNRCDLISTPTKTTKKELAIHGCRKPIKIISNGINPHQFDNHDAEKIKQKYNPKGPLCVFVGRIAHEKNLLFLIESFKKVTKYVPSAKLLIVGGGPQTKQIKSKIISSELTNHIHMLGEIPHEKLVKSGIYKACDIFLTASKTENQAITILESQINGLPCIGMKAKGIPDLITNGKNGYTVEPDNSDAFAKKTVKLLKNKKLLQKMQKHAVEMAKKHDIEKIITTWEKTYQKMIKKNSNLRS